MTYLKNLYHLVCHSALRGLSEGMRLLWVSLMVFGLLVPQVQDFEGVQEVVQGVEQVQVLEPVAGQVPELGVARE